MNYIEIFYLSIWSNVDLDEQEKNRLPKKIVSEKELVSLDDEKIKKTKKRCMQCTHRLWSEKVSYENSSCCSVMWVPLESSVAIEKF